MIPCDLSPIAELYSESLKKHGMTPMGVGWRDDDSQRLRFSKLLEVVDCSPPFSVNELGSGYGALFEYLRENEMPIKAYRAHEISAEMLLAAEKRIGGNDMVQLTDSSQLDRMADYSFASGIFNVRFEYDDAEWTKYILDTLSNLNTHSINGFSFNLLSTYVDFREPHLYYGDPLFFFDYCKKNFGKFVSLYHDYPLYEWTITVRK